MTKRRHKQWERSFIGITSFHHRVFVFAQEKSVCESYTNMYIILLWLSREEKMEKIKQKNEEKKKNN